MDTCPSSQQLRALLAHELQGAEAEAVEAHVEQCAACQEALEEQTAAFPTQQSEPTDQRAGDSDFLRRLQEQTPHGIRPAPQPASDATLAHREAPADAPAQPTVPGYEVLAELGRGGMGVVYKARHLALNRVVALKMVLAGGHAGPQELARFRTEAEAVARLQHPHIVQIYEVGEQNGLPYFSLEFCPGGSLAGQLGGKPLPPARAAALVETLARAMHAAHQAGVVHRDLKPANVLLAADGTPKVTDFGLAKKLDESAGPTVSGAIMGTPSYMAPEQAGGRRQQIGPATDVYALGAILYELLTGRSPFRAETATETLLQVLQCEPEPPRRVRPGAPRDLETIALKCLRKEPRSRYASAGELADDLRRFQQGEPIQARLPSLCERLWHRRRRLLAAVAVLLVLALLGLLAHVLLGWQQERRDREFNEVYARGVQQFDSGQARQAIASFDEAFRLRPDALALAQRGRAHVDVREYDRALADSDEALRLDPENALAYRVRGSALLALRRHEEAVASLTKAIDLDPQAVIPRRNRATAYLRMRRWPDAAKDIDAWLSLAPRDPALYEMRSILHAAQGHWAEAARDYALTGSQEASAGGALFTEAAAHLADGDRARYRDVCGRLLKLADSTAGTAAAMAMGFFSPSRAAARAFALAAKPDIEPEQLLRLNDAGPHVPGRPTNIFFQRITALVWLRVGGRAKDAVRQLEAGLAADRHYSPGINHLLLNIAYRQLGEEKQAELALQRALDAGIPVNHVHDTLEYQVLLREVQNARKPP
jgi:tetratricopeptide (TPR) repeat protein